MRLFIFLIVHTFARLPWFEDAWEGTKGMVTRRVEAFWRVTVPEKLDNVKDDIEEYIDKVCDCDAEAHRYDELILTSMIRLMKY